MEREMRGSQKGISKSLSVFCPAGLITKVKNHLCAPIGGKNSWRPQLRRCWSPLFRGRRGLHKRERRVQGLASAKVRLDRSLSPCLFSLDQSLGQRPSNLHQYDLTAVVIVNISYEDWLQHMGVQSIDNELLAY